MRASHPLDPLGCHASGSRLNAFCLMCIALTSSLLHPRAIAVASLPSRSPTWFIRLRWLLSRLLVGRRSASRPTIRDSRSALAFRVAWFSESNQRRPSLSPRDQTFPSPSRLLGGSQAVATGRLFCMSVLIALANGRGANRTHYLQLMRLATDRWSSLLCELLLA